MCVGFLGSEKFSEKLPDKEADFGDLGVEACGPEGREGRLLKLCGMALSDAPCRLMRGITAS